VAQHAFGNRAQRGELVAAEPVEDQRNNDFLAMQEYPQIRNA
jgi:hypothetical protein